MKKQQYAVIDIIEFALVTNLLTLPIVKQMLKFIEVIIIACPNLYKIGMLISFNFRLTKIKSVNEYKVLELHANEII